MQRNALRTCLGEFHGETLAETDRRHQARRRRPGCSQSRCSLPQNRSVPARQSNRELRILADPTIDLDRAAMLLGYDVIADRKPEARPLAGRLGGEERLKELVFDLQWNANAVVADVDFDRIAQIASRHLQGRLELR